MSQEKLGSLSILGLLNLIIKYGPTVAAIVKQLIDLLPKPKAELLQAGENLEAGRLIKILAIIKFVEKYADLDIAMYVDIVALIKNPSVSGAEALVAKYEGLVLQEVKGLIDLFKE